MGGGEKRRKLGVSMPNFYRNTPPLGGRKKTEAKSSLGGRETL